VIGTTLGFAVMTLAPLSGASFNPARWFGPAVASGNWTNFWIYLVGPILGALAAALLYRALVLNPQGREPQRPIDTLD
jgi:glycerol uptake facilitator-like aquaporin